MCGVEGRERLSTTPWGPESVLPSRVVCTAACAVAEAEERAAARVGTAAGGASVSLRTSVPWALLPTRVTFPVRTALSF
jgi:hypothetical protein